MSQATKAQFTGRHMLAIMVAFFGVIIAVNVTMAVVANTSWTGFVVKNSYVASQEFNEKARVARAQEALGWTGKLEVGGGAVRFRLTDAADRPVAMASAVATFRRPAYENEDLHVELAAIGSGLVEAPGRLRDGLWIVEILAEAGLDHPYRDAHRIVIRDGRLQ